MPNKFEISLKNITITILILVGGWLLLQILDIIALLLISFIFMAALRPGVDEIEKYGISRILATLIMYVIVISFLVVFSTLVFPPLVNETVRFAIQLPRYIPDMMPYVNTNIDALLQQIPPLTQNLARVTVGVFSNFITMISIAVFTFYFLLEHKNLDLYLDTFIGKELGSRVTAIIRKIEERLGVWIRGQAILAFVIGLASYIGLVILGVNFALPLALIAGLLEVIPIMGPIISAVPAVLVALTISPALALAVVALYIIIQQLENNLVVPQVMRKTVGLPPLVSLLALMIGGRLAGIVGIVLAIPTLLVIQTVSKELITSSKLK